MMRGYETIRFGAALLAALFFATLISAQSSAQTEATVPAATEPGSSPTGAAILADEVRSRIHAARSLRKRAAKKASYEAAIPIARQLAEQQPGAESSELLATALLGAGRYLEGQHTARQWVARSPGDWLAQSYLGNALTATEDYESALAPLERALDLAPTHRKNGVARSLGFALEKLKRLEQALAVYESAGDERSAVRVRENIETIASLSNVEDGCWEPALRREEAEQLEKELKALEDP